MAETDTTWLTFVEHAALSDVGLRRSNNQDSCAVVLASDQRNWRERGHLFLVADGMGAHAAGELASKLAAGGIPHTYHKLLDLPPPEALRQSVIESNAHIHGRGEANAEFHGMGTTTSVLVLLPQGAIVAHVGDSRVYRFRRGRLEQLTFDHSLVWEMMATGQLPSRRRGQFHSQKHHHPLARAARRGEGRSGRAACRSKPATPSCSAATACRAR